MWVNWWLTEEGNGDQRRHTESGSALEVSSRRCAIQIHILLYYTSTLPPSLKFVRPSFRVLWHIFLVFMLQGLTCLNGHCMRLNVRLIEALMLYTWQDRRAGITRRNCPTYSWQMFVYITWQFEASPLRKSDNNSLSFCHTQFFLEFPSIVVKQRSKKFAAKSRLCNNAFCKFV